MHRERPGRAAELSESLALLHENLAYFLRPESLFKSKVRSGRRGGRPGVPRQCARRWAPEEMCRHMLFLLGHGRRLSALLACTPPICLAGVHWTA
jgi:hypothetical protein